MERNSAKLSRRALLASSAAAGIAAVAASGAAENKVPGNKAVGAKVIGNVPRGTMRVYQIGEQKSFSTLTMVEGPVPVPGPGQALIRVHYAGIAARDQGIVMQQFPVPPGPRPATRIPLSEGAGEVLAVGAGETRIQPGDRVTSCHWAQWVNGPWTPANYAADVGNTIDGWLGEMILLPTSGLAKLPVSISSEHAATFSGSGLTVWHALHEVAHVRSDDIVLTLGTGGVSSFGLLLAKAAGALVVVTSSSDEKLAEMKKLGADITVGRGASVVLENVGPGTLDQSMAACGNNARIVMIGTSRPPPNPPNMYGMYMKNLMLKAISAGSRSMLENMITAMAQNKLQPVIARTIAFADAVQAYQELRDGDHIGKIVIKVS
jgi:NADPH:quinone reductase-like Zn-dependent oxidoreductase